MDITPKLILTFVVTLIGSQGLWILLSKISEKRSATSQLIRGLAHEQIVDKGMQYIHRGWISNDEYDDFLNYLYIALAYIILNFILYKCVISNTFLQFLSYFFTLISLL